MKKITILSLGLLLGAAAQPALAQSTTTGRAAASSTSSIPSSATASFPELRGKKWDQLNDAERQALLRTANPDWDKWSVDQRSAATSGYRTQ
jgi:phage terminase Nu1 subunit (DNA packaging protein)